MGDRSWEEKGSCLDLWSSLNGEEEKVTGLPAFQLKGNPILKCFPRLLDKKLSYFLKTIALSKNTANSQPSKHSNFRVQISSDHYRMADQSPL